MAEVQTYATHRRFHPIFHFVGFPLAILALGWTIRGLYKSPSLDTTMELLAAFVLVLAIFLARYYGLRVQDRLIRLEETLRMKTILPSDLQARIGELRPGQFVGLRFASDGELADRVREALDEKLGGEDVKKRIQTWRGDYFRV